MESVHGQDDRKRERHAMDGVWLPADGEPPVTRSLPGSRHKPEPGIAKGEAFSPLARRRSPEVNRSAASTRRNRIKPNRRICTMKRALSFDRALFIYMAVREG